MTLLFYVNHQSLTLAENNFEVASDSRNYLKVKFIFQTKDWKADEIKYALFSYKGKTYKKYLGIEEGVAENECFVAPEVIKPGEFTVAVFTEGRITTNAVKIPVKQSGYTDNIENVTATPTALDQMDTLMYQYANVCNEILKECQRIQRELREENK